MLRKQMRQFSIHKVNKPTLQGKVRGGGAESADEAMEVSYHGANGGDRGTVGGVNVQSRGGEEQPSLLSNEEQQAL